MICLASVLLKLPGPSAFGTHHTQDGILTSPLSFPKPRTASPTRRSLDVTPLPAKPYLASHRVPRCSRPPSSRPCHPAIHDATGCSLPPGRPIYSRPQRPKQRFHTPVRLHKSPHIRTEVINVKTALLPADTKPHVDSPLHCS